MMPTPIITVIVAYANRPDSLKVFCHTVRKRPKQIEIIIVSLGSPDPLAARLCKAARVTLIEVPYRGVFRIAVAHNIAAEIAQGAILFKQDIDTVPHEGFYESLVDYVKTKNLKQWYGCVGCWYLNATASRAICASFSRDITYNVTSAMLERFQRPSGTFYLVARTLYLQLGGTDETFCGWGFEDYSLLASLHIITGGSPESFCNADPTLSLSRTIHDAMAGPKVEEAYNAGLVLLHRFHKRDFAADPPYYANEDFNLTLLHKHVNQLTELYSMGLMKGCADEGIALIRSSVNRRRSSAFLSIVPRKARL